MNIREIAKLAGVSAATVSRVFGNHPGIGETTRARVFAAASAHGYHPRVGERRKNVVIIIPYHGVFPVQSCVDMLLMALARELPGRGFRLEILPLDNLERLETIPFCGAVAIGVESSALSFWGDRFYAPLVVVDRALGDSVGGNLFCVRSDEAQGMALGIEEFRRRGRRRVGCLIHGEAGEGNASLRAAGVRRALAEYGYASDDSWVRFAGSGEERYLELTGKLLKQGADALFCPGGNAGIAVLYALSLYGKSVPGDVGLIASEQTFFSHLAVPPQTTVTPDYAGLARRAGDQLEAWLNNGTPERSVILPYELLRRESG